MFNQCCFSRLRCDHCWYKTSSFCLVFCFLEAWQWKCFLLKWEVFVMLSFCKRTVFVSDNVFFFSFAGRPSWIWLSWQSGSFQRHWTYPQCLPLHLIYFLVFRFSSGSSVLSSRFHPTLQTKDFLIFAYFVCLKERNGTSLKMQDFIISDIAKLNR